MSERARILVHARGRFTPDECDFWRRASGAIDKQGADLWLLTHNHPQAPIDLPHARVPNGLDGAGPLADRVHEDDATARARLAADGLDADALLARERLWRGGESSEAQVSRRLRALRVYQAIYAGALEACRPHVVMVWNGEHPQEIILRTLAANTGAHACVLERGPFAGTIHPDDTGVLGASGAALRAQWSWRSAPERAHWLEVFDRLRDRRRAAGSTWWSQPDSVGPDALRQRLGVREGERILLFLGQVDADAQGFLFAPGYRDNLDAWRALTQSLDGCGARNVFVLGKHHPKSQAAPAHYEAALGKRRGAWVVDASIQDCLALADWVSAVNSTALFEALLLSRPCLMLGRGVLSGKGVAREAHGRVSARDVDTWLADADGQERLARFRDFGAHMLANDLFTMRSEDERLGLRGVDGLASWLLVRAAGRALLARVNGGIDPWREPVLTRDGDLQVRDVTRTGLAAGA